MGVDILTSRRDYYEKCCWWSRDMLASRIFYGDNENEIDPERVNELLIDHDNSELVFEHQPIGIFYAKEYVPETFSNNSVGGVFLYDNATVTLKTPDDIDGIRQNDLVRYQCKLWMVDSVQKQQYRQKSSEFANDKNAIHFWFIKLRRY